MPQPQYVDRYRTDRKNFEDFLVEECWYSRTIAENCDDWRDERLDKERQQSK